MMLELMGEAVIKDTIQRVIKVGVVVLLQRTGDCLRRKCSQRGEES